MAGISIKKIRLYYYIREFYNSSNEYIHFHVDELTTRGISCRYWYKLVTEAFDISKAYVPDNVSINFTPNFFEDDKNKYNGHGYGQDFYSWMYLLSHEVTHIKHIEECGNEISYLGSFLKDYITYGHDNTPREKEADEGTNNLKAFDKYINDHYGKNSLDKLFKSDKSDKQKIRTINQWWNEYKNETHINGIIF